MIFLRAHALGPAFIVAGIVLAGGGMRSVPVRAAQTDNNEGLALFSKMMPVFTSPRCVNCHGDTNPVTGENHHC
jgi:hypothetical protein